MRYAKRDLAEYVNDLKETKPEQFAKFGPKQLERWFEKYSQEKPAFAAKKEEVPATHAPASNGATKPVRKPVTTTTRQARPPAPAEKDGNGVFKGKTVKAGQPNSMNKSELREYYRSIGRKTPY
jgi:hypothetical protein